MEIKGNYLEVLGKDGSARGYVTLADKDEGLGIDRIFRDMGLDPDFTYYRFVEEKPDSEPLEREKAWRDIKTWGDVVKACEGNKRLYAEYRDANGSESWYPRLAYEMVKWAIDGACRPGKHGYVPQLAITKEGSYPSKVIEFYPVVGRLLRDGTWYSVFQASPSINLGSPVIDKRLMNCLDPFEGYDWLAVSSIEKAMHVSKHFFNVLLATVYGDVDYKWEEA